MQEAEIHVTCIRISQAQTQEEGPRNGARINMTPTGPHANHPNGMLLYGTLPCPGCQSQSADRHDEGFQQVAHAVALFEPVGGRQAGSARRQFAVDQMYLWFVLQ